MRKALLLRSRSSGETNLRCSFTPTLIPTPKVVIPLPCGWGLLKHLRTPKRPEVILPRNMLDSAFAFWDQEVERRVESGLTLKVQDSWGVWGRTVKHEGPVPPKQHLLGQDGYENKGFVFFEGNEVADANLDHLTNGAGVLKPISLTACASAARQVARSGPRSASEVGPARTQPRQ